MDLEAIDAAGTAYGHGLYAASLADHGTPHWLPRARGWLLVRPIPGTHDLDAVGCYPLFTCEDWAMLADDLADLPDHVVTVSVVADPFGCHTPELLRNCFPDRVIAFKQHLIVDLARPSQDFVSAHHQRYARKAAAAVDVSCCGRPLDLLDEWTALYDVLIERHSIGGWARFSKSAFYRQLQVPGLKMLEARHHGELVGATLWYVRNDVGYYHLGAWNERGYRLNVSFALFSFAISLFSKELRWLDLGAGPGISADQADGLTRFKHGWATGTRTAYFCGRILRPERYHELAGPHVRDADSGVFPAYRSAKRPS